LSLISFFFFIIFFLLFYSSSFFTFFRTGFEEFSSLTPFPPKASISVVLLLVAAYRHVLARAAFFLFCCFGSLSLAELSFTLRPFFFSLASTTASLSY
jgi:hypothetical protein